MQVPVNPQARDIMWYMICNENDDVADEVWLLVGIDGLLLGIELSRVAHEIEFKREAWVSEYKGKSEY